MKWRFRLWATSRRDMTTRVVCESVHRYLWTARLFAFPFLFIPAPGFYIWSAQVLPVFQEEDP
jgi:hypothetical protein